MPFMSNASHPENARDLKTLEAIGRIYCDAHQFSAIPGESLPVRRF